MKRSKKEVTLLPCIVMVPHGGHRFDVVLGHVEIDLVEMQTTRMERRHIAEIVNAMPGLLAEIDEEKF